MMYSSNYQKNPAFIQQQKQLQSSLQNGHSNGRIENGRRTHVLDNIYSQQQQQPNKIVEYNYSNSNSPQQQCCNCCPYGYHIDLGFVKFAEDIATGKEQIQNWSNSEKKRNRRLLASPSSDKTMLDLSSSDIANISASYPNNDSILSSTNFSPYMDEEELPELIDQQQFNNKNNSNYYLNNHQHIYDKQYLNNNRQTSSNNPLTHQHQLQSILKKNSTFGKIQNFFITFNHYKHSDISSKETLGKHRFPQQQHQSRFYEAHVHQNKQQPSFLSTIENSQFIEETEMSSPTNTFSAMAPLRTSTPKGVLLPLHIATNAFDADGCGATSSAPSSPASSLQHLPAYKATIAHDLAQLRNTPSRGTIIQAKTQPYTSIASLSSSIRGVFNNNKSRQQHVISPEPRMLIPNHPIKQNDDILRSSNMQSRAYFHQNMGGSSSQKNSADMPLMPYRSRGGRTTTPLISQQKTGSSMQLTNGTTNLGGSTLELADFASVRRRRLEADIGTRSPIIPSAHLVRSVSPPMYFPASKTTPVGGNIQSTPYTYSSNNNLATYSTSPSSQNYSNSISSNFNKIIEENEDNDSNKHLNKPIPPTKHVSQNDETEEIRTSIKDINIKNKKFNSISADFIKENVSIKPITFMRNFGTQTISTKKSPVVKKLKNIVDEVGISADLLSNVLPKKIRLKEASTSTNPIIFETSKPKELPFSSLIKFASIAVDTTEIEELEENNQIKNCLKKPPQPPPKPSRPDLEEELRRRRQAEVLASLSTEFQYCLGHEPEHLPTQQQKEDKSVETVDLTPKIHKETVTTSTTDLTYFVNVSVGTINPEMIEKSMETEIIKKNVYKLNQKDEAKQLIEIEKLIKDETEKRIKLENEKLKFLLTEVGIQTETDWLEREIQDKLAEAEAERREKRKRLSMERSTETDDDESPDQFIMITCNKCEQRSSIATDEVFEKIVDDKNEELNDFIKTNQQHSEHSSLGEILETLSEEPELLLSNKLNEEKSLEDKLNKTERRSKYINTNNLTSTDISEAFDDKLININEKEQQSNISVIEQCIVPLFIPIVHELRRMSDEFKSVDMTDYVLIPSDDEDKSVNKIVEQILEYKEDSLQNVLKISLLHKAKEFISISLLNEDILKFEEAKQQEKHEQIYYEQNLIKQEQSEQKLENKHLQQEKNSEKHSENTQLLNEHSEQTNKQIQEQQKQIVSTSPMSSDEGLVLAEEEMFDEFGVQEIDLPLDIDADRFSIDTDVQTVIYVEQEGGISSTFPQTRSSSSASTKTPNTSISGDTNTTNNNTTSIAASARTDALRKLLTEPPRNSSITSAFFQRAADSNRSYRTDKSRAQQLQLEYIADKHKSTDIHNCSEPSTPTTSQSVFDENTQQETTRKALKETIKLKKNISSSSPSTSTSPPDPIPARIPRPKIARYSPNVAYAETPDEEAEAADRLTPLRSEMRSLSSSSWGGGSSSPRMSQRSLIFRTHIEDPLEEEDDDEINFDNNFQSFLDNNIVDDDVVLPSSPSSSSDSDGGRTYEMSEEESSEFFELSAPLQDALETINDHLMQQNLKTTKLNDKHEKQEEKQTKNNQLEWAYKYTQHEWLKMATKKNTNAEVVEQFIDALESYSTQLMDTVINMTDQNGNTALHYAVSNENFDVISVLLDSKVCLIDKMNTAGYSTLMLGALCELHNETESAIMQRLFHMGNVNAKAVKHAQTALMLAASHGRIEATNLLLKCGADVNIQDVDGSTALMCAAEHGQKEIVKILLKQPNIDASLTDCDNQTALSIAVENHYRDIGVLIYAHLNFSNRSGETSNLTTSSSFTTNTITCLVFPVYLFWNFI
ncbi:hypothetical protein Mgra_00003542 [Meloidogyne graminicola]|uniref:ANK_REP_REGION domain-containing protein n=1 Tax=Meloidogyne graminicola TaxID=189291 RepID=A0A8S9ZVF1_9BILA|nr:hypothetical protein Mgra_00003542 [Meloidogyne graminicola]